MEFLRLFLRRHLAGKPVVASPNVGCFLRLLNCWHFFRVWALVHEWYILLLLRAQSIKAYGGGFTWHWGDFGAGMSSLRFPLMALYLFSWYHHKISCRRESPRREFTPLLSRGEIFTPVRNLQRCHLNAKRPLASVWNRCAGRLERVAHA